MDRSRYALGLLVAVGMLAGCGGSQPPSAVPQSRVASTHAQRSGSWMLPEAMSADLLYVSANISGELYAFAYPKGGLVGTVTGLSNPAGLCTDGAGNVWVVTVAASGRGTLLEYAHGGTMPIASLGIPGTWPYGCAVDKRTGDLAVTSSGDSVSVFAHASGAPTTYTASDFYHMYYCGYDGKGNLFADGNSQSGAQLAELPKGSSSMEDVTINAPISYPGAVQWDGKYLAIAELSSHTVGKIAIYRVSVAGSKGKVVGTVTLIGKHFFGGFQGWLQGGTYIQPNKQSHDEGLWKYPTGGRPVRNDTTSGAGQLWGATVSVAPSR